MDTQFSHACVVREMNKTQKGACAKRIGVATTHWYCRPIISAILLQLWPCAVMTHWDWSFHQIWHNGNLENWKIYWKIIDLSWTSRNPYWSGWFRGTLILGNHQISGRSTTIYYLRINQRFTKATRLTFWSPNLPKNLNHSVLCSCSS